MSDPVAVYQADLCTAAANLSGLPAVNIPSAIWENQHPVGVQLMGRPFAESTLLQAAFSLESTGTRPAYPESIRSLIGDEKEGS